ncbi:hypothetical protein F2Q68_00004904 [Brassica cretica]|uniref:Uncharacterized protein n=1 Tax=Brassica cretica TaxID=69181 RepID=A0A8S9J8V9_BRACR|nr:hypothetical protein F2Q68_00004904 [Brassica cretica]
MRELLFRDVCSLLPFGDQPIDDYTGCRTLFSVERRRAEAGNHTPHWEPMLWMDGIQSQCSAQSLPSSIPCV